MILPMSCKRRFLKMSVGGLHSALIHTAALDIREKYAGAIPSIFLKHLFWNPSSWVRWAFVSVTPAKVDLHFSLPWLVTGNCYVQALLEKLIDSNDSDTILAPACFDCGNFYVAARVSLQFSC